MPDVVVIGGGVIGCSIAYELARRGATVTVLERERIGAHASGGSAGILSPSHEGGSFATLASAGLALFPEVAPQLREETGIDIEFQQAGVLTLVTPEVAESARGLVGPEVRWLVGSEIHELEPALRGGWAGALFAPSDGQVNTGRLTAALAEGAVRLGATVREGVAVERMLDSGNGVMTSGGAVSADHVVLAAGPWSGPLSEALGVPLPVRPVKGQLVWARKRPSPLHRPVFLPGGYLAPKYEMGITIGATEEDAGFDERTTLSGTAALIRLGVEACPALADAELIRIWASLRPASGDGLPIIGPVPDMPRLIVASGHFRNGVLLSLITGRLVSDSIEGRWPALDLAPFSPGRFLRIAKT
jgi:glycine oxidase